MKPIPMTSLRQDWKTPKAFYQALHAEFNFDCDPCPPKHSADGLLSEWGLVNFINPPFKGIEKWIAKAFSEYKKGKVCVLLYEGQRDKIYKGATSL